MSVEIKLQECCYTCEEPDIYVDKATILTGWGTPFDEKVTVGCKHERVCKHLREPEEGEEE